MDPVTVDRLALLETLGYVDAGLTPRDTIDQSSCYVFRAGWVATYNEEICCRAKSPLPTDFEGAVAAAPLRRTLEALSDPEVTVALGDREVRIRAGRVRVKVRREAEILLPVDSVGRPDAWIDLPDDFGDAVAQVVLAAGNDDDELMACTVHFTPEFLEASDRFQGCRYAIETGIPGSFLVRAKALKKAAALGVRRAGLSDGWVHFRNTRLVVSCRKFADQFPDLSRFYQTRGTPLKLPSGGTVAVDIAKLFSSADKDDDKVRVSVTAGEMVISGRGPRGESHYPLDCEYAGEPLEFLVKPKLLAALFENAAECEVSPNRVRVDGENWKYVAVLVRPAPAGVTTPVQSVPVEA